ncbi:hypothetical protein MVEN_02334200 [Mycena venus]|uniref:Uncharacterized protein n=1 Tax=Mycena venus TaxID=2733690 RepID=A0A8H7CE18_9AGAR|nr:hypothetical protein MVEN_02334200 [Mycena venus]
MKTAQAEVSRILPRHLRHITRGAKFTFTFPLPPPKPISSPAAGLKRAKGHLDPPTPNPSPEKQRIFKRGSRDAILPPSPLIFNPAGLPSHRRGPEDVCGPVNPRPRAGGYSSEDSDIEADDKGQQDLNVSDEFSWGPEDDAPPPPESQLIQSAFFIDTHSYHGPIQARERVQATESDTGSVVGRLPALADISDDEGDTYDAESMPGLDDVDNMNDELPYDTPTHRPRPLFPGPSEDKATRLERENREYTERAEEKRLREVDAKRMKAARKRVGATERMQQFRARKHEQKIADGWVPGQKRSTRSS